MSFSSTYKRVGEKLTWPIVGILVAVLVVFAGLRGYETLSGYSGDDIFKLRYLDHPIISAIHMICGITFILFAPLQFSKKLRTKRRNLHRQMGRVLMICAMISGLYGIVSIVALPVFGGFASATAAWLFGPLFIICIARSFWCIRRKMVAQHREWMIRALSIALGVATQRVLIIMFMITSGYDFEEIFGPAQWLGFSLNLLLAEIWINLSRTKR